MQNRVQTLQFFSNRMAWLRVSNFVKYCWMLVFMYLSFSNQEMNFNSATNIHPSTAVKSLLTKLETLSLQVVTGHFMECCPQSVVSIVVYINNNIILVLALLLNWKLLPLYIVIQGALTQSCHLEKPWHFNWHLAKNSSPSTIHMSM